MYEHTSLMYDTIVADQQRIDRANELRRFVAENSSRVIPRERPIFSWVRRLFGIGRADAAMPAAVRASSASPAAAGSRVVRDSAGWTAHAG